MLFPGAKRRQIVPQAFRHTSPYIFVPTSFFPLTGGCLELLQKQQEMKYQPNWMGEIIETMDWGLTYKFRDNLLSFCKRNLALLSLFLSLSHLFCSFRLRLFCCVGDSAIRAEKR